MGKQLQYFKENVSIIQVVEALGYQYNRRKGRNPLQYEHPNGDKVIISNKVNPSMEVYFTRNNYDDKGTVVDFVKNRLSMFNVYYNSEWEGVLKVLSEFAGKPFDDRRPATQTIDKLEKKQQPFRPDDFEISTPSIRDLSYLYHDRHLNKEALKIFLPFIRLVRDKESSFRNIGFTYTIPRQGGQAGEDKISGFELVNHLFKGHAKGSQRRDAVWLANLAPSSQLVTDMYIGESAIDAMSFYQQYIGKYNFDNSLFISTGGNVLKNQVVNVLKAFPRAKVHTIFDNDFSGHMYDIYLAGLKSNKEIAIKKNRNSVRFELKKGIFEIPMDQISLARFERITGIRSGIRSHKSKGKDFNEMLQKRFGEKESLKSTKTFKR